MLVKLSGVETIKKKPGVTDACLYSQLFRRLRPAWATFKGTLSQNKTQEGAGDVT
jgi:hypothetical protein